LKQNYVWTTARSGAARFPCPAFVLRRKISGIRRKSGSVRATGRRKACAAASCRARGRDWAGLRLRSVLQGRLRGCSDTCVLFYRCRGGISSPPVHGPQLRAAAVSLKRYPDTKQSKIQNKRAACAALGGLGTRRYVFNFEEDGRGRPSLHYQLRSFGPTGQVLFLLGG